MIMDDFNGIDKSPPNYLLTKLDRLLTVTYDDQR